MSSNILTDVDSQIELFVKRFNCACNRIKNVHQKELNFRELTATSLVPGLKYNASYYWELDKLSATIHPIAEMLVGRKRIIRITPYAIPHLELNLFFGKSLIYQPFLQGFVNRPSYRNVWRDHPYEYKYPAPSSLMFNLGRAFLYKFCGINLEHQLPPKFQKIFDQLR